MSRGDKKDKTNKLITGIILLLFVAPGNVASPGKVIIYGKCRTIAGKCRNLLKTLYTPLPVYVALLTGNVAKKSLPVYVATSTGNVAIIINIASW